MWQLKTDRIGAGRYLVRRCRGADSWQIRLEDFQGCSNSVSSPTTSHISHSSFVNSEETIYKTREIKEKRTMTGRIMRGEKIGICTGLCDCCTRNFHQSRRTDADLLDQEPLAPFANSQW